MSAIERFATSTVPPAQRLAFWNRLTQETYPGTTVDHAGPAFKAEMLRWNLGDLTMIRPRSQASVVSRQPDSQATDRLVLHLQHAGRSRHRQAGREADMAVGDFSLCNAGEPYRIDLTTGHELLVVEMPRGALEARVPQLDDWIARTLPGTSPSGRLLHNFLLSLWQQGDQSHADPVWQAGVANVFLDLLGLAVKSADLPEAPSPALRGRVLAYIEAALTDPELGTATLAANFGVSMRTIQNVFAGMTTTPSAYIQQRRLQRAADRLASEPHASITGIAFDLGFNDSAYFTRCFRQQFGTAPRSWREHAAHAA